MSGSAVNTPQKPFPVLPPDRGQRAHQSPRHNPHPYAIKTTSTALLSRTNSNGNRVQTHHSYVPTSPCPSPTAKHRFTKSESTIGYPSFLPASPRPLPIPPSLESPTKVASDDHRGKGDKTRQRTWSAGRGRASASPPPSPVKVDDLPSNPRVWTTTQLSSYLITALRVRNGDNLPIPPPVAKDIVGFVKDAKLTGRTFLRFNEQDFEHMGINHLWRTALLDASRHLRQNVLKGRIWGFEEEDEPDRSPFSYARYNSSSSSVDSVASLDSTPLKSVKRNGRVRGMVETLERSASVSSNSSSGSFKEAIGDNTDPYEEEAVASEDEINDRHCSSPVGSPKSRRDITRGSPNVNGSGLPLTPPQYPLNDFTSEVVIASQASEPSVHELLSSDEMSKSWGAKAWEEFDVAAGVTMKRLAPVGVGSEDASHSLDRSGAGDSGGEHLKPSRGRIQADEVFSTSRPLPTPPGPRVKGVDPQQTPTKLVKKHESIQTDVDTAITVDATLQTDIELSPNQKSDGSSNAELSTALALLEKYRERLAAVEAKLAELEHEDESLNRMFTSQTVQTTPEADGRNSDVPSCSSCTMNPVKPGDTIIHTAHTTESESELNSNAELPSPSLEGEGQLTPSGDPSKVLAVSDCGRVHRETKGAHVGWDPLEHGLSSYVLMVGVGVCAIVIQTLMRRLAGKKA